MYTDLLGIFQPTHPHPHKKDLEIGTVRNDVVILMVSLKKTCINFFSRVRLNQKGSPETI